MRNNQNTHCYPREAIQPGCMLFASTLGLLGAVGGLIFDPETTRNNPFFYTAMGNSTIYIIANMIRMKQLWNEPRTEVTQARSEPLREIITITREPVNER